MTNEQTLAAIAGVVLSLLFSYVPGMREWFDALEGTYKRLLMLALLAIVSVGIFVLGCAGVVQGIPCTQDGGWQLLQLFIAAAIANQTAYSFAPKPQPVIEVMMDEDFVKRMNADAVDTDFQP
jgi:hypothetical protein